MQGGQIASSFSEYRNGAGGACVKYPNLLNIVRHMNTSTDVLQARINQFAPNDNRRLNYSFDIGIGANPVHTVR